MDLSRSSRWVLCILAAAGLFGIQSALAQSASAQAASGQSSMADRGPAHNFGLRIEPGVAFPLSSPQTERFGTGGGQTFKLFYNLTPWLDVGPSVAFSDFPAADSFSRSGTAWDFGAGFRLKRPVSGNKGISFVPWLDTDALYVRTGELDRFGYDAGAGLSFAFGPGRSFRIGPFVRYRQILQPERSGFDNRDARLFHAGLSFELAAPLRAVSSRSSTKPAPATTMDADDENETAQDDERGAMAEKKCEPCPEPEKSAAPADRDGDGVPDAFDPCVDVEGPKENYGCPDRDNIVVTPNKIDLKERILFDWDSDEIKEESHDILNTVADVLKRNDGFTVRIEGHADATGLEAYNQELSKRRAKSVVDYLVDQGVSRDRFVMRGYSSSRPVDTNLTDAGRQKNRRVEFVIDLEIMDFDRNKGSNQ